MRLRTFTAPDMQAALKQVREELGDNAVILGSQAHKGKKGVTVTAAVDPDDSPSPAGGGSGWGHNETPSKIAPLPASPLRGEEAHVPERLRFEIQETLRFHNIPELFIAKIMNANRGAWKTDARHSLEQLLAAYFKFEPLLFPSPLAGEGGAQRRERGYLNEDSFSKIPPLPSPPPQGGREYGIMLVGPPGIGKTLTIARLAAKLALARQPLLVITTDNKRAGGIEQLQAFTNILDVPLAIATKPNELRARLKDVRTYVLIDTAGCNPYDAKELKELAAFADQEGLDPVLTLPAGGDSLEAIDTVEAFMQLPVKRLLVTRTDTARRFGGVLSAAAAHQLAFCNISNSSSITAPLLPMDGALLTQLLLQYKLQI